MFCKYCGKPIDEGTMRCRICGRPVGPLEGGNGFWDLAGEKPADGAAAPVDNAQLQELQEQVLRLRQEVEAQPAQKKGALGAVAALLALLALALGVFALLQLRGMAGKMEDLSRALSGQPAQVVTTVPPHAETVTDAPATTGETAATEEETTGASAGTEQTVIGAEPGGTEQIGLRTPWEMDGVEKTELDDGVTYVLWPDYFDGPRGDTDTSKRQSIHPRDPVIRQIDLSNIFNATFLGQHTPDPDKGIAADPGNFVCYWAKVELDEDGKLTSVERVPVAEDAEHPDPEKDRFVDKIGANNAHSLFIIGGAEEGEEGCYALIAERTNSLTGRYAYVSEIIELYINKA